MNRRRALLSLAPALLASAWLARAWATPLRRAAAVPGGVARVRSARCPSARAHLGKDRVLVVRDGDEWVALVGIALAGEGGRETPGGRGALGRRASAVRGRTSWPKQYAAQHLKVAPGHVELSSEDLARYEREREHLAGVRRHSPMRRRRRCSLQPTPGQRSSSFGLRRVFNGQSRSPHSGMDIAAPSGTPVVAANSGTGDRHRRLLLPRPHRILDHGQGPALALLAPERDRGAASATRSSAGAPIGKVGATGRVTGPHLHWSVYLNRASSIRRCSSPIDQRGGVARSSPARRRRASAARVRAEPPLDLGRLDLAAVRGEVLVEVLRLDVVHELVGERVVDRPVETQVVRRVVGQIDLVARDRVGSRRGAAGTAIAPPSHPGTGGAGPRSRRRPPAAGRPGGG